MTRKQVIEQAKKELRNKLRGKRVKEWIVKDPREGVVTITAYSPNRGNPTINKRYGKD